MQILLDRVDGKTISQKISLKKSSIYYCQLKLDLQNNYISALFDKVFKFSIKTDFQYQVIIPFLMNQKYYQIGTAFEKYPSFKINKKKNEILNSLLLMNKCKKDFDILSSVDKLFFELLGNLSIETEVCYFFLGSIKLNDNDVVKLVQYLAKLKSITHQTFTIFGVGKIENKSLKNIKIDRKIMDLNE